MSKDQAPIPEYLDAMQPNAPDPDPPDTPTRAAVKKGSKWGSIAGFIVAQLVIASNSVETPFGPIYGGSMVAVFAVCIGGATAFGAAIAWLSVRDAGDDDNPPQPDFPKEPFG